MRYTTPEMDVIEVETSDVILASNNNNNNNNKPPETDEDTEGF